MIQLDSQFFVVVELPGYADQMIPEILVDPPIPNLVRIGQGGSGYLSPESNVIELFVMGVQACLDIPQAFPVGELCESHAEELVVTGKPSDSFWTPYFYNLLIAGKKHPFEKIFGTTSEGGLSVGTVA